MTRPNLSAVGRRRLVPAVAAAAPTLAFGLAMFAFVLTGADHLLGDPDTQWHVAVGRWIWTHRTVPTTDIFSHTFAGAPWIAKEWLSQLLLFGADAVAGWWGVTVLAATAIALAFASLFGWLRRRMRATVALAITLASLALAQSHFLARPHILVLPVVIAWLLMLATSLEKGRAPPAAAAGLMLLWTNMHGSFPFGLVIAGVLAGEAVVWAAPVVRGRVLRGWATFLILAAATTMISPFGWRAVLVPLKMSGNAETLRFVGEWAPLGPDMLGLLAAAALVATAAVLLLDYRANAFRLLATGLVAYLMLRHVRFVGLFAVVAPVLVARSLAARFPPSPGGAAARWLWPVSVAAAGCAALGVAVVARPMLAPGVTPSAAFRAAEAYGVRGPVFNDYDFGGFLIAHGVPTFVDGRTDQLFLGAFLPDLAKAARAKDEGAFAAMLARYKVEWALVRPHSRMAGHFDRQPGWSKIYGDGVAAVYVAVSHA